MARHLGITNLFVLTALGCAGSGSNVNGQYTHTSSDGSFTQTAEIRGAGPERPERPQLSRPVKEHDARPDIEQTSFISRPSLRAAIHSVRGLPELKGRVAASVMARVNGKPILFEEVLTAASPRLNELKPRVPPAQWNDVQERIIQMQLEEQINQELVLQDAMTRIRPEMMEQVRELARQRFESTLSQEKQTLGIKTDEELQDKLAEDGRSLAAMQRDFERRFIAREYLRSRMQPKVQLIGRNEMLDYYQANTKEFENSEEVNWQHMFIDVDRFKTREDARSHAEQMLAAIRDIQDDSEFGPLAKEHSHGPSRYLDGKGEGKERGTIRPAHLEELVFSLEPGKTGDIVEVSRGFHIVRVISHRPAGKIPFEEACNQIRRKLQDQTANEEYKIIVDRLRTKAYIENAFAEEGG